MSGAPGRAAVFLEEMGIGPLWTLRAGVDAVAEVAADAVQPVASIESVPAAAPAPAPAAVAPPATAAAAAAAAPAAPLPMQPPPPVYQPGHEPRSPLVRTAPSESAWADDEVAAPVSDEDIARMGWAELRTAINNCTRCGLCSGGRKAVHGSGAQQARWLVAAGATSANDEKEGQAVSGDAGKLLANMLAAAGLSRESNVWVTNLVKCRPVNANGAERAPTAEEASACRPFLEREAALTGAGLVLTIGQIAANGLLGKPLAEPLAATRGQVHELHGVPLVATLHPGELLRRGADKALAWSDLCLAKAHDGRQG